MAIRRGTKGNEALKGTAKADRILAFGGNDRLIGLNGDDRLNGGSGNDRLMGGAGNDILNGGTGNDTMIGGAGNDTYSVNSKRDKVIEKAADSGDMIVGSISIDLNRYGGIERASLSGSKSLSLTGNASANILIGNAGANIISGGDGLDQLFGGAGSDKLDGGVGNDIMNGDSGADQMIGGAGDDAYFIDDDKDTITEDADAMIGGIDRVFSSNTIIDLTVLSGGVGLEDVFLLGNLDLIAAGNDSANFMSGNEGKNFLQGLGGSDSLFGGAGDDTLGGGFLGVDGDFLDGGTGADIMAAGDGNDTYIVDNIGDSINDSAGVDEVRCSSFNIDLISGTFGNGSVDNATLLGTSRLNIQGSILDNVLTGNNNNNQISGGGGADTLRGLDGDDIIRGDAGNDIIEGGNGHDEIIPGQGADTIFLNKDPFVDVNFTDIYRYSIGDLDGSLDRYEGFMNNSIIFGGDFIDVTDLFTFGMDPTGGLTAVDHMNDYISVRSDGGTGCIYSVDPNGGISGGIGFVDFIHFVNFGPGTGVSFLYKGTVETV